MIRGLDTSVKRLRKQVFTEVARVAWESDNINEDIEAIPYKITPGDVPLYRESIWRERAICAERVRLAMGMSLRPEDQPVHVTAGITESNISEKYYEPPLMQVIPSACDACAVKRYKVTDNCRGCVAHPCVEVCPKGAISLQNGRSVIDQDKCIKCGKCRAACPYSAIAYETRPCADACGVNAIESDELGRARINPDKCVSCGMCMVNCPFGAIADKSQIFQLIRALKEGGEIIAEIAPAYIGQFGNAGPKKVKAALMELGFSEVYEVALGADMGAVTEAHHYVEEVVNGDLPFLVHAGEALLPGYGGQGIQRADAHGGDGPHDQEETSERKSGIRGTLRFEEAGGIPPLRAQRCRLCYHFRGAGSHVRRKGHRPGEART